MKAKTFENLIRKVVREEIDYALRREIKTLKEDLRDELKPTIVEQEEIVEMETRVISWEHQRDLLRAEVGYLLKLKRGETAHEPTDVLNRV